MPISLTDAEARICFFFFLKIYFLGFFMPLIVQDSEVMTGSEVEKRWGKDREMTAGQT